jgi:hypothetical protein
MPHLHGSTLLPTSPRQKQSLNAANEIAPMAFRAFRDICDLCRRTLVDQIQVFLQLILRDEFVALPVSVMSMMPGVFNSFYRPNHVCK